MSDDGRRLLIISPVRNEAAHIETVARSIQDQTRPPDLWLVVDDGSTDGTCELAAELAKAIPCMRVLRTPVDYTKDVGDRHAVAAAPRAFNWALRTVDLSGFTHVGKLDGDIELPPEYFAQLLAEFDRDANLGVGGGVLVEQVDSSWRRIRAAPGHVRGALKLYSRDCFESIGGLREHLGWDGVDQTYARMRGFETRSFDTIVARHHRSCGTADGVLRGRMRGGQTHYVIGFSFSWVLLKALKSSLMRPRLVSGLAFLYGYLRAAWRRMPRIDDAEYRRFIRDDERRRLIASFRGGQLRLRRDQGAPVQQTP